MAYEFNQGFLRAYENNKELVGGPYPAEQDDWGFRDGSSFTQLRTRNGLLEWADYARGGQRITFTDLRDLDHLKRYVLQDPPSNKLVEVPGPGRQNPDTGELIDNPHDTPSTGHETPIPGPEPTPPKEDPAPAANELRISDYAGGKTLGKNSQADLDAQDRLYDAALKKGDEQTMVYDLEGIFKVRARDVPQSLRLSVTGLGMDRVVLFHPPEAHTTLFRGNVGTLQDFAANQNGRKSQMVWQFIAQLTGKDQVVRRVRCIDPGWIGIRAEGENALLEDVEIYCDSPGGLHTKPNGEVGFMGIHTEYSARGTRIVRPYVTGSGFNGIFLSGLNERIEGGLLEGCHRAHNEPGFGGGQAILGGRKATVLDLELRYPAEHGSGLEIDINGNWETDGHTVRVYSHHHEKYNGITSQKGRHKILSGTRSEYNRVGLQVSKEGAGTTWEHGVILANNIDDDLVID